MLHNLKIDSKLVPPFVLLPGDPGRVDLIGQEFNSFRILNFNREFKTGLGNYKGVEVLVASTGIGCPSTAMVVEELIVAGAQVFIRIGTCGGAWRKDILAGSIVIPTACVRDEGTTKEYIPQGFPAVADWSVLSSLIQAAQQRKLEYFAGINRTHDAFFGSLAAITKWGSYLKEDRWMEQDTPILSSEMETAALFVVASLNNVQAGAVLAVNAEPESLRERLFGQKQQVVSETNPEVTKSAVKAAIITALEAILILNEKQ